MLCSLPLGGTERRNGALPVVSEGCSSFPGLASLACPGIGSLMADAGATISTHQQRR
jgi:hypothetical protein